MAKNCIIIIPEMGLMIEWPRLAFYSFLGKLCERSIGQYANGAASLLIQDEGFQLSS